MASLSQTLVGCKSAEEWVRFDRSKIGFVDETLPAFVEPIAQLSNAPADDSTDASMLATVGGTAVESYLYKIGPAGTLDCTDTSGYSAVRAIAQVVNDSIDDKMGALAICVLGVDAHGRQQTAANATRYEWNRTWFPKIFVESPGRTASSAAAVTVHLHAPAEYNQVYLTDDSTCLAGGAWQARSDTKAYSLDMAMAGGTAMVYARFRTAGGKLSPCVSHGVLLSPAMVPTACAGTITTSAYSGSFTDSGGAGGDYASDEDCTLNVTSPFPITFTITSFDIEEDYEYLTFYKTSAIPANELAQYTGTFSPAPVTNTGTTLVNFTSDSSVEQAGFVLNWDLADATSLMNAVSINNDDESTATLAVSLTILNSVGLKEMYITNDGTCAAGGTWEPYAYTKSWNLSAGNGTKTVGIKFRDWENHETPCETDAIQYYSGAPTAILSGLPANGHGGDNLAVTVGGTDTVKYKYKLGVAGTTDCAVAAGYSTTAVPIATLITASLTSYSSVSLKLCVIGVNPIGTQQSYATAASHTWTRQVPLYLEVSESGRWVNEGDQNITFTIKAVGGGTSATPVTIDYDLFGELVPELGLTSGQVVLPANQNTVNVVVPILANVAADVDKRLSLGIAKVSGSHKIGAQSSGGMTVRDGQRAVTGTVVDVGPRTTCNVLGSGALMCSGSIGTSTGAGTYSHGFTQLAVGTNFKKVIVDQNHSCALSMADELWCWGWNYDGQLGLGDSTDRGVPTKIPTLTWKKVISHKNWNVMCGIDSADDLYCWGDYDYSYGLLGAGPASGDMRSPTKIDAANKYKELAIGDYTACAITMANKLKCWGSNTSGAVGDGTGTDRYAPVAVDATRDYVTVQMTMSSGCGITSGKDIYCWGGNVSGTVPTLVDSSRDYVSLAIGGKLDCALSDTSELYCWGYDYQNRMGFGENIDTPVAVDPGTTYVEVVASNPGIHCGRRTDNRVKCFGHMLAENAMYEQTDAPILPTVWDADSFVSLKAIDMGICGITTSGHAKCVGRSYDNEVATDAPVMDARTSSINVGTSFAYNAISEKCALDSNGYLRCWANKQLLGYDSTNGQRTNPIVELATSFKFLSVGYRGGCAIQTSNDALWCWGSYSGNGASSTVTAPVVIDAGTAYKKVSVGDNNTCAITSTDTLKCWGSNSGGTVGVGDTTPRLTPTTVGAGTYSEIAVSDQMACGISLVGVLQCWGSNIAGIGNSSSSSNSPAVIAAGTAFSKVEVTTGNGCAIRSSDSRIMCWGSGASVGDGGASNRATPVLVNDTAVYVALYSSEDTAPSGGGTMCGKAVNGGSFDVKCWGAYQWPRKTSPTVIYTGSVKDATVASGGTVLMVDAAGSLYYHGYAKNAPGIVQRMKHFEFLQGLIDR